MRYSLVYDFAREPFWMWELLPLGLVLTLAGVLFLRLKPRPTWNPRSGKVFGAFALLFGGLMLFGAFPQNYLRYRFLHKEIQGGRVKTVVGLVTGFHAVPPGAHDRESFSVEGVRFAYSDYDQMSGGFNRTRARGGPIRGGLPVRIGYVDGSIVRLEIGQELP